MGFKLGKRKAAGSIVLNAMTIVITLLIIISSLYFVRDKMLKNAQSLGTALTQSYATEQQAQMRMFEDYLDIGSQYVNELIRSGADDKEIQNWMVDYFKKITKLYGDKVIDPYAVIGGKIIAVTPWEGDNSYEYEDTEWYQMAMADKGKVVFTDTYEDAITKESIITSSIALEDEGAVLAMDIYPSKLQGLRNAFTEEIEGNSLYLCDSKGHLIYAKTPWNKPSEKLDEYAHTLFDNVQKGYFASYDDSFKDFNNERRGVYYSQMENGWMIIMTIPFDTLLLGESNVLMYGLLAVGGILILILLFMFVRDILHSRKIKEADRTVSILSDSFYAIYRVNLKTGMYTTLKNAADMDEKVGMNGTYDHLLQMIETVVEKGTYQEFAFCFSLDSIKQRVKEHIADYGGDYKRRFNDRYKWVNIRTLYNEKISSEEVILCFRDVDVEKRQELQYTLLLQETLETNKKSAEAKEAFFSNMSHEMRTPLNAIIGFSKLALESGDMSDKNKEYIKKISFSGQNMLSLINDILELSRLEAGHSHLDYRDFNLEECIHNISGSFEAKAMEDKKDFKVNIDIKNKYIKGDELKVVQILNNLLSNAFKYSDAGDKVLLEVKELEYRQYHKIRFTIKDSGIGMSASFLNHLFEPYARETHFSTKSTIGTGLGMPIVKSLVEQMSGEIDVESKLKEGTTFVVTLPFEVANTQVSEEKKDEKQTENVLQGKKVLLAEVNELNREIATEILQMHDLEVICAENGKEALDIFQSSSPYSFDLILMDMQMPIMDGCEASEKIRSLDRDDARSIPIIAVTANAFSEDVARVLRSGMNAHIAKPIDFNVLQEVMKAHLK